MTGTFEGHASVPANGYEPPGYDEAFEADGSPRAHYADLIAGLGEVDLSDLGDRVTRLMVDQGVHFGEGQGSTFRIDPIPRILEGSEWLVLERGLVQRMRALAAFVADVHGDRTIVAAGRVPARVIESADDFEPWMTGVQLPLGGYVAGLDLVRDSDAVLRVLEDNIRTPSGMAYVLAAREALDLHLGVTPAPERADPSPALDMLGAALRSAAPEGVHEPNVVVLSDGPENSAWFEHQRIAQALDIPLVSREDLLVGSGRLFAELGGARPQQVDVVYRRTNVDRLRDAAGRSTWLADCLLAPVRRGTLSVVNPFGSGVADDKLVHAYVEEMVRFYLGEEPVLESVPTYDLGEPDVREKALSRLGELVVKPRSGLGGEGIVVCPHASPGDRELIERRVKDDPESWVAQELVAISTHPTVIDGRLEPRHVDLRPFVVGGGEGAKAVPGALTRVAFGEGSLVVNSAQNGGAKDTWVMSS
ncbi:MAG: circularly permuted type 2 ATP-grasp protein [Thermoleophilaceae bacterium]